jgi:hypothetical protein
MQIVRKSDGQREISAGILLVAVLVLAVALHLGTRSAA